MNLKQCTNLSQMVLITALLIIPPITTAQGTLQEFDLLLLSSTSRQSIHLVNTSDRSRNAAITLPNLQDRDYAQVTPDVSSNTLYWTNGRGTIGYYNLTTQEHAVLYKRGKDTRIYDLTYTANKLYWRESAQAVKAMEVNGSNVHTVIRAGEQEKVMGFTLDYKTGTLYYATWPKYSLSNAKIYSFNLTQNKSTLVASNLKFPSFLSFQPPYLYWASAQPGNYFQVERLNVHAPTNKSVIAKQQHQHVSSLAATCSGVYWTDIDGKHVWEIDSGDGVPGGRRLGDDELGETKEVAWAQVVGVNKYCPRGTDKVFKMIRDHESAPAQVLPTSTNSPTTVFTTTAASTESSGSSSSESAEVAPHKDIRLCDHSEFLDTCGSDATGVVCVVIGDVAKPLCLSQVSRFTTPPAATEEPATSTAKLLSAAPEEHLNATFNGNEHNSTTPTWPPEVIIIISVLSTLATVMSLISLYMTIRVRNLSKKPIIRRRVVVSHRTSESGSSTPASVCEMIDIENCCNMNVCETPCYERTLLNPSTPNTSSTCTTSTTQNGTTLISVNSSNSNWGGGCGAKNPGKDDKKCLLSR